MNYTYKQLRAPWDFSVVRDDMILRVEDMAYIPFAPSNVDYKAYLAWLEEGNTPLEPDPAPVIDPE